MAITIKNGSGTDVDYVRTSFVMEDAVTQRGTLTFQHIGTTRPLDWGEDVFVYDGATKIWGGTVEKYDEVDITVGETTTLRWTYRCVDFSELASRRIVIGLPTSLTAGAAATSIVSNYLTLEGVTAGTIEDGALLDFISWNYIPAEMALDELAEISGFYWNIDKDKALHFRSISSNAAAWDISNSSRPYRNIRFSESRSNFATRVYLRAGSQVGDNNITETQYGDGAKRAFAVGNEIGETPTVEVDTGGGFASQTVGVNGVGTSSQWYYNIGTNVIVQDSGETLLTSTDRVKITYKARFPIIVSAVNDEAETARAAAESGSGVYEMVMDALDVTEAEEAELKAKALLDQYSSARLTVSYTTDTTGLAAGMSQLINLTEHGINAYFLLERVSAAMLDDGTLRYNVEGAATQTVAGWSYWKQKTRQDRKFVIRDNETLVVLKTPQDDMTFADAPSTATTTGSGTTVGAADAYVELIDVG